MWRIFGQKKSVNAFTAALSFDGDAYTSFVIESLRGQDRFTLAMVIVAYANIQFILNAARTLQIGDRSNALTAQKFIESSSKAVLNEKLNEVNLRRHSWFLFSALLYRATHDVDASAASFEELANLWCEVAECAPVLKGLLPHNVVWSEEEKEAVSPIYEGDDLDAMIYVIHWIVGKRIWACSALEEFAHKHGVTYLGTGSSLFGPFHRLRHRGK